MPETVGMVLDRLEQKRVNGDEIEIPLNGNSLDLLRAVYRCSDLPLTTRMRAAIAALNYELPRLQVTAQISENDIATVLDRRIKRLQEMRLLEANGNKVVGAEVEAEPVEPEPIEVKPPTPSQRYRIYSRFNRRF
jgi:hypothetical protein